MRVYRIPRRNSIFEGISLTSKIIYINVTLFVVALALVYFFGANFWNYIAIKPSNILQGKYLWTFLTSMFMHAGLFHLFANMFSLFFIGTLVEKIIGARRYLYFYLTTGILSGLLFVLTANFFGDVNTYAVGASGALFGLVGFLMIITPNLSVYIMFIPIPIKMKYAAPGILILLWIISAAGNIPIGNTAHLGGLIVGLIYGFYLRKKFPRKTASLSRMFH